MQCKVMNKISIETYRIWILFYTFWELQGLELMDLEKMV